MNRRQFFRAGLASLMLMRSTVWALPAVQQAQSNRLLIILLRGAYDGNSLLVPHGYPFYYQSRPNIAIPSPQEGNPDAAIDLGQGYGLHPVLRDSVFPLYVRKQAAFVPFSGSQDVSRSHFEAQDLMELGQPLAHGHPDDTSGFLGRLVQVLHDAKDPVGGISFTNRLPLSFKGGQEIPNIALTGKVSDVPDDHRMQLVQQMYAGSGLDSWLKSGMQTRDKVSATLLKDMQDASRSAGSSNQFALTAQRMAVLMRDNPAFGVGFIDVGGWDSHINQGAAKGMLASNLEQLATGLAAFADTTGAPAWQKTVVVVMSEFGRTFRENGTHGTDHGHGNTLWVLGGGIRGGRLAGDMADLTPDKLFQSRDTPVLNDYRSVLGHLMQRMYGLNNHELEQVFPGAPRQDFALI